MPKEETEVKSEEKTLEPMQENPVSEVKGVLNLTILMQIEENKEEKEETPNTQVESVEKKPVEEDEESLVMACEKS